MGTKSNAEDRGDPNVASRFEKDGPGTELAGAHDGHLGRPVA